MQDVAQQERATAADAAYEDIFRQLVRGMLTHSVSTRGCSAFITLINTSYYGIFS